MAEEIGGFYEFGITIYECLFGKTPFYNENPKKPGTSPKRYTPCKYGSAYI
jgi:serine/threonine protein kinase